MILVEPDIHLIFIGASQLWARGTFKNVCKICQHKPLFTCQNKAPMILNLYPVPAPIPRIVYSYFGFNMILPITMHKRVLVLCCFLLRIFIGFRQSLSQRISLYTTSSYVRYQMIKKIPCHDAYLKFLVK